MESIKNIIAKSSIESFESVNLKRVFLVVYGDNIATFIKGRGTSVINLEKTPKIDKEKEEKKRQAKQVAGKILEEQIAKAIEYLKDEENRKKVVEAGVAVAQFVISIAAKKKK